MRAAPIFPTDHLTIIPWPDDMIDLLGHDARGDYVEKYWLGVLGPTATWIVRRLAKDLTERPDGFRLDLREYAGGVGIGMNGGQHSAFTRALARLVKFEVAQLQPGGVLAVRLKLPDLSRRHLLRLPAGLQAEHAIWQQHQLQGSLRSA